MKPMELRAGCVVQIDPNLKDCFFPGCFMLVTEPKTWGAQGFIAMPQTREEPPTCAGFRATWEQMELVGSAAWVLQNYTEERIEQTAEVHVARSEETHTHNFSKKIKE